MLPKLITKGEKSWQIAWLGLDVFDVIGPLDGSRIVHVGDTFGLNNLGQFLSIRRGDR